MRLEAGCELVFDVAEPTPMILMLRPRSGAGQWMTQESCVLEPFVPVNEYVDGYGNLCQRLVAPVGRFAVTAGVTADVPSVIDVQFGAPATPIQYLPESFLQFLLPSRYCQADFLEGLAREVVGGAQPGYDQVEAIRGWVHRNVAYRYGTSNASTSAIDTASTREGVCRDFAHLGMALCRSLNIPARMVVGYLHQLEPMDLHAWFEAFVSNRWFTFDATQETPRGGRIVIAYGRDAADVALATHFGSAMMASMRVWVSEPGRRGSVTGEDQPRV